jgi:hypothetical protein
LDLYDPMLHNSKMEAGKENLTHEEIWDDRALVNSWNDALEEYKASKRPGSRIVERGAGRVLT